MIGIKRAYTYPHTINIYTQYLLQIRIEALLLKESFSQTETCIGTAMTTAKELLETGTSTKQSLNLKVGYHIAYLKFEIILNNI